MAELLYKRINVRDTAAGYLTTNVAMYVYSHKADIEYFLSK